MSSSNAEREQDFNAKHILILGVKSWGDLLIIPQGPDTRWWFCISNGGPWYRGEGCSLEYATKRAHWLLREYENGREVGRTLGGIPKP